MRTLQSLAAMAALALTLTFGSVTVSLAQHDEHGTSEHGAAEHGSAEHGEHGAPSIDPLKLGAQFFNFACYAAIVFFVASRILPKLLADRRADIVNGLEEAKRMKQEAEAKFEEYSKRIDTMDHELDRVREDMKKAGLDERDRIVKEASDKAEKMRAEARFLVEQQMKQLREELTREAIEAAIGAAERILREKTNAADQQRLADEYLGRLKSSVAQKGAQS